MNGPIQIRPNDPSRIAEANVLQAVVNHHLSRMADDMFFLAPEGIWKVCAAPRIGLASAPQASEGPAIYLENDEPVSGVGIMERWRDEQWFAAQNNTCSFSQVQDPLNWDPPPFFIVSKTMSLEEFRATWPIARRIPDLSREANAPAR